MLPQLIGLKKAALDVLFPQWCIGCGKEGGFICPSCRSSLPVVTSPLCPSCGSPQANGMPCAGCSGRPAAIDGIRSPFRFDGVIRDAIHQFKYRNLRALAAPLAGLLVDYIATSPLPGEVMVPVPLHRKRLRERGYNQAGLLAREIGKLTGLPVIDNCLIRLRHTPPQTSTPAAGARWDNMAGAFACGNGRLDGRQVLIIDDVSTSGATLNSCAAALKAAGATSIWGLVLARDIQKRGIEKET